GRKLWPCWLIRRAGLARLPGRPGTIQSNREIFPYQGSVGMKRPPMRSLSERACPQKFTGVWHRVNMMQCLGGGSKTLLLSVISVARDRSLWGAFRAFHLTVPLIWRETKGRGAGKKPPREDRFWGAG